MSDFGKKLRNLRVKKSMTQKELADKFNVSESAIGMYERGAREPNFDQINKFAEFFDVKPSYFIDEDSDDSSRGQAYYGGGEDWTEEEKEIANAAVEAYRRIKNNEKNRH